MTDINLIDAFERIPVKIFPDLKNGSEKKQPEMKNVY
jgi:hypothetical protein